MRILKVNIPKKGDDGLEAIEMNKKELGKVVLLAGKNGAGKSRILQRILEELNIKPTNSQIKICISEKRKMEENLKNIKEGLRSLELELKKGHINNEYFNKQISSLKPDQKIFEIQLSKINEILGRNTIQTDQNYEYYTAINFVPKEIDLVDYNNYQLGQISKYAEDINNLGTNVLKIGTYSKIKIVQDTWFNSTHQLLDIPEVQKKEAIEQYEKLQTLIRTFFGTELSRNLMEPTIFGLPICESKLSDGQKILLQFCVAIFSQQIKLNEVILVLDEPENHLHPSAIIEVITTLERVLTNGQIWIATHSVPLIAHFDPESLWYVEKGKIEYAGKIPEKVLESLLGDYEQIAKLQNFISLPAQFASARYALECLLEPTVVTTTGSDPQTNQIRKNLLEISQGNKLKVLDYGAGKGRLLSNILENDENSETKLLDSINYYAFDEFDSNKEICRKVIESAYGLNENRYFNKMSELISQLRKETFDVIILCNVLHEIDPKNWINLFKEGGEISQMLKPEGMLLLVEDNQIPIGEKAYLNGFIVLDTPDLLELFNVSADENLDINDYRGDGRLKSHFIPKKYLIRINSDSKEKALKSKLELLKREILKLREDKGENISYKNGNLHAFYVQQFANTSLALSEVAS